jgi:peptidoglycan/xylan/chitin deacetylase (PgdA/CDA1 family)
MATIYGARKDGIREITFTFDDGPSVKNTPKLLDILSKYGIQSVFFVLGERLKTTTARAIVHRAKREGHTIGNHSFNHANLRTLSNEQIVEQVKKTEEQILECTGGGRCDLFRPPYGATNSRIADILKELGYTQVLWSVDTMDWKYKQEGAWVDYGLQQIKAREDSIVLMHDIHASTVDNIESLIKKIKKLPHTRFVPY